MACLSADARENYGEMFRTMSVDELRKMGDSFAGFQLMEKWADEYQEAAIVRGDRAGIASFVRINGNWKLQQL